MKLLLFIYVQRKMLSGCGLHHHNDWSSFSFFICTYKCDMIMHTCMEIRRKVATMESIGVAREASGSVLGRYHVGPGTGTVLQMMVPVTNLILNRTCLLFQTQFR